MRKVLLTGSEGYLGSSLQTYFSLHYSDYSFVCVDRKLGNEVFDIKSLDGIDFILHLAAQPSVFNSDVNQIQKDNIDAFEYICDLSKKSEVPLIYASSATAHDKNVSSFYGESKRLNEIYASTHNPNSIGLRFHNIYSFNPRNDTLFYHLLNDSRISLAFKGQIIRHFTYMPDILESIAFTLDNYSRLDRGVYNVLNPQANTIYEFALEVKKYRPKLQIILETDIQGRDTPAQYVDETLPSIPINFKTIKEGIKDVFCTYLLDEANT